MDSGMFSYGNALGLTTYPADDIDINTVNSSCNDPINDATNNYTSGMPSPSSSSLSCLHSQHPSLHNSYPLSSSPSSSCAPRHRRSPDTLIDLDAPVQPRRYVTPSSTSRKDIPSYYLKRRPQVQISDEEDDELTEELPANATDQERIEHKRHRNTIAARRSRRRKMAYQQQLEDMVEQLTREKEKWKTRAETLRQIAQSRGVVVPDWPED